MRLSVAHVKVLKAIADGGFDGARDRPPVGVLMHLVSHGLIEKLMPWSGYSLTRLGRRQIEKALRHE